MFIRLPVMKPAAIDLEGVDKIMVGNITGQGGAPLARELGLAMSNNQRYHLLDDNYFRGLMATHDVQFKGTAFITGHVAIHHYAEKAATETFQDSKTKEQKTKTTVTGTATVEVVLKVIDPNSGSVAGLKRFRKASTSVHYAYDQRPKPIDRAILLRNARAQVISDFMKMIVPYWQTYSFSVMKNEEIPQMVAGVEAIRVNQWEQAIGHFATVNSGPAVYNTGLCYLCLGQYDKAEGSFVRAAGMDPAIARIASQRAALVRQMKADSARVSRQMSQKGAAPTIAKVKKPTPKPKPVVKPKPKPVVKPKPKPVAKPPKVEGPVFPTPNRWTTGGVEARLLEVRYLNSGFVVAGRQLQPSQPGLKLVGVRGIYKNVTDNPLTYAHLRLNAPALPTMTLTTDKGKTYFQSLQTIGLIPPFRGLGAGQSYECWAVFEVAPNEKVVSLQGIMVGSTQVWRVSAK
jgi:hypothetical protein